MTEACGSKKWSSESRLHGQTCFLVRRTTDLCWHHVIFFTKLYEFCSVISWHMFFFRLGLPGIIIRILGAGCALWRGTGSQKKGLPLDAKLKFVFELVNGLLQSLLSDPPPRSYYVADYGHVELRLPSWRHSGSCEIRTAGCYRYSIQLNNPSPIFEGKMCRWLMSEEKDAMSRWSIWEALDDQTRLSSYVACWCDATQHQQQIDSCINRHC